MPHLVLPAGAGKDEAAQLDPDADEQYPRRPEITRRLACFDRLQPCMAMRKAATNIAISSDEPMLSLYRLKLRFGMSASGCRCRRARANGGCRLRSHDKCAFCQN